MTVRGRKLLCWRTHHQAATYKLSHRTVLKPPQNHAHTAAGSLAQALAVGAALSHYHQLPQQAFTWATNVTAIPSDGEHHGWGYRTEPYGPPAILLEGFELSSLVIVYGHWGFYCCFTCCLD